MFLGKIKHFHINHSYSLSFLKNIVRKNIFFILVVFWIKWCDLCIVRTVFIQNKGKRRGRRNVNKKKKHWKEQWRESDIRSVLFKNDLGGWFVRQQNKTTTTTTINRKTAKKKYFVFFVSISFCSFEYNKKNVRVDENRKI